MIECNKTKCPIEVIAGEAKDINFNLLNKKTKLPYDISLATEIEVIFDGKDDTAIVKTLTGGGVEIVSGPGGSGIAHLLEIDTLNLELPPDHDDVLSNYDEKLSSVEIRVTIDGKRKIAQLKNSLKVSNTLYPNVS